MSERVPLSSEELKSNPSLSPLCSNADQHEDNRKFITVLLVRSCMFAAVTTMLLAHNLGSFPTYFFAFCACSLGDILPRSCKCVHKIHG